MSVEQIVALATIAIVAVTTGVNWHLHRVLNAWMAGVEHGWRLARHQEQQG